MTASSASKNRFRDKAYVMEYISPVAGNFDWEFQQLKSIISSAATIDKDNEKRIERLLQQAEEEPEHPASDDVGEFVNDIMYTGNQVSETFNACLALIAGANVESCFIVLSKLLGETLPGRANWGTKRGSVEKHIGKDILADLDGYETVQINRILANCFKHNDSIVNKDAKSELNKINQSHGFQIDQQIDFGETDFTKLVEATESFCKAAYDTVADHLDQQPRTDD